MATRTSPEDLLKVTNFNRAEIDSLTNQFTSLATVMDKIDRSRFRDLLADTFGVDDSLLMDRVFRCFDMDADNYIGYDEFMKGMSVFLKGRKEERIKFCFRVYDLNGDRYISKEEMFQMLKNCLVKGAEEDEDGVKDLVDLVLKKLDEDRDGRVSETDWNGAIEKESLLMEAFGQCLPTSKVCQMFIGIEEEDSDPKSRGLQSANRMELPAKPTKASHTTKPVAKKSAVAPPPAPAAAANTAAAATTAAAKPAAVKKAGA
ncbi:UNVERIFIED_CONTAM: EF-hand calcium-binding domain-containing protein 1 [Siphonaria sp. JEL0065]|nr:EF-hand calcium-binding domain-containing protein 1 [Siphonaria sp. JEL0065]